jgi:hypothetical protein
MRDTPVSNENRFREVIEVTDPVMDLRRQSSRTSP